MCLCWKGGEKTEDACLPTAGKAGKKNPEIEGKRLKVFEFRVQGSAYCPMPVAFFTLSFVRQLPD
jgi:hypothetical protein